jgi:hypothetical protein
VALAATVPDVEDAAGGLQAVQAGGQVFLLLPLVNAAVAAALVRELDGAPVNALQALGSAFSRSAALILATALAAVAVLCGAFLLIVPGVILFIWLQFVPQAVVLEGRGALDALRRCPALAPNVRAWLRTLGITLLLNLVAGVAALAVLGTVAALLGDTSERTLLITTLVVALPVQILVLPVQAVGQTLLFMDLRARAGEAVPA